MLEGVLAPCLGVTLLQVQSRVAAGRGEQESPARATAMSLVPARVAQEGLLILLFSLQGTSCLKMPAERDCPLPSGMALPWSPG